MRWISLRTALQSALIVWIMACLAPALHAALPTRPTDNFTSGVVAPFFEAPLGENAQLAVLVLDPVTGRRFADFGAGQPLRPASLQKLFTAAMALDTLGPSHRFLTTVETHGELDSAGVLHGDLIVRGGGDPTLGPHFQTDRSGVTKVFRDWVADLKAAGILRIDGDIIGDDSLFESDPHAVGWDPVDFGEWYAAEVSALTFNDGCADIRWRAGAGPGKPARYKLAPETSYLVFESAVKTGGLPGQGAAISAYRADDQGKTIARGMIAPDSEAVTSTAVREPARYTAHVFREVLQEEGLSVSGTARTPWPGQDADPPDSQPRVLVRHYSPALAEILPAVLAHSQNLYAETILRSVALKQGAPASFDGAAAVLAEWTQRKGFDRTGLLFADGSGLSSYNRISARAIGELLAQMSGWGQNKAIFRHSLARAGETGTLANRLPGLRGRFTGKTGSLTGTSALAGYLETRNGHSYIVVLMIGNASGSMPLHRDVLDDMLERLDQRLP